MDTSYVTLRFVHSLDLAGLADCLRADTLTLPPHINIGVCGGTKLVDVYRVIERAGIERDCDLDLTFVGVEAFCSAQMNAVVAIVESGGEVERRHAAVKPLHTSKFPFRAHITLSVWPTAEDAHREVERLRTLAWPRAMRAQLVVHVAEVLDEKGYEFDQPITAALLTKQDIVAFAREHGTTPRQVLCRLERRGHRGDATALKKKEIPSDCPPHIRASFLRRVEAFDGYDAQLPYDVAFVGDVVWFIIKWSGNYLYRCDAADALQPPPPPPEDPAAIARREEERLAALASEADRAEKERAEYLALQAQREEDSKLVHLVGRDEFQELMARDPAQADRVRDLYDKIVWRKGAPQPDPWRPEDCDDN